jgi:hypothetical protein
MDAPRLSGMSLSSALRADFVGLMAEVGLANKGACRSIPIASLGLWIVMKGVQDLDYLSALPPEP